MMRGRGRTTAAARGVAVILTSTRRLSSLFQLPQDYFQVGQLRLSHSGEPEAQGEMFCPGLPSECSRALALPCPLFPGSASPRPCIPRADEGQGTRAGWRLGRQCFLQDFRLPGLASLVSVDADRPLFVGSTRLEVKGRGVQSSG